MKDKLQIGKIMTRIILFILLLSTSLLAAVDTNNTAQNVILLFKNAAAAWQSIIIPAAKWLFFTLVTIDWVISFGYLALKGTDFAELFSELIKKVMIIGFFLLLFQMVGWLDTIAKSLSQLADKATLAASSGVAGGAVVNIQPDTILEQGIEIVLSIFGGMSVLTPASNLGLFFAGIIILIAFVMMAAELFIVIVKIYILIAGSYIVFALGGLSYTRSYAINPLISIIKAGMELFFIKLILGLCVITVQNMAAAVATDNASIIGMIAVSILLASLTRMVPGLVESLISGHFAGNSNSGFGTAAAVGAGAAAVVGGAVGAGSAIKAAKGLSSAGQGSTLGNLAKAAGVDAINTITGANRYAQGNAGTRMAGSMKGMTDTIKLKNEEDESKPSNQNNQSQKSNQSSGSGSNDFVGAIKSAASSSSSNSEYISGVNPDVTK